MKRLLQRQQLVNVLAGLIFPLIIVAALLIHLLLPDRTFSDVENRQLQSFPAFTAAGLADGSDFTDMDDWFADQFPGRDLFFHLNYLVKKATGVKQISDVFLGSDQLFQQAEAPQADVVDANTSALNAFALSTEAPVRLMIVPTSAQVQKKRLPSLATSWNEQAALKDIEGQLDKNILHLDASAALEAQKDDYIYYRSDHHWTTYGAYLAFREYAKSCQFELPDLSSYLIYPVSDNFEGTLASKTGSVGIKDQIDIYAPATNPDYICTYSDGTKKRTVYDLEALKHKDQYQVFFGGNEPLIRLEMNNSQSGHLLVLKDSYANCFIPFLIPYYRTITIVDPRYYYDDLSQLMQSDLISDVLVLFNYNNFTSDASLASVLSSATTAGQTPEEETPAEEVTQ